MRKAEQGASYLTILIVALFAGLVIKAILVIWPAYWDDRIINSQIEELVKTSAPNDNITPEQISRQMDQRLEINNIRNLKFNDIAKISNQNGIHVMKQYEIRKPYLFNIDLVLKFEKNFDQSSVQTQ